MASNSGLYTYFRLRYSPTRFLTEKGMREGLFGGRRAWLVVFVLFRGAVAVKRAATRHEEFVALDRLKPGERIIIRSIPVSSGKERKRLLRGG